MQKLLIPIKITAILHPARGRPPHHSNSTIITQLWDNFGTNQITDSSTDKKKYNISVFSVFKNKTYCSRLLLGARC